MKYQRLGKTGLLVSELCLGTMTFGKGDKNSWGMPTCDEKTSHKIMDTFVARGGNFFDTANVYGAGESELVIGTWLANKSPEFRESIVIATKARLEMGTGPNDNGNSRKHLSAQIEASLRRLQCKYIDLYQLHNWDNDTPLEETLSTLNDFVRCGKIRYIGLSNFTGWQIQKAVDIAKYHGWEPITCLQPQYSLLCRDIEYDALPVCVNEGLGVLPWSPLCGGWLSGKYKPGMQKPEEGRVAWAENVGWDQTSWATLNNDHTWGVLKEVTEISEELNVSIAQVSLRWILQRKGVTSPIIGARTIEQLEDNIKCIDFKLTDEQMTRLTKASTRQLRYPFDLHCSKPRTNYMKDWQ